jgi:hypothetical protein
MLDHDSGRALCCLQRCGGHAGCANGDSIRHDPVGADWHVFWRCLCACVCVCTVTLQWDKLKKSGNFPHIARWYDFCDAQPPLRQAAEKYGRKRRVEVMKEKADTGKGGGSECLLYLNMQSLTKRSMKNFSAPACF